MTPDQVNLLRNIADGDGDGVISHAVGLVVTYLGLVKMLSSNADERAEMYQTATYYGSAKLRLVGCVLSYSNRLGTIWKSHHSVPVNLFVH